MGKVKILENDFVDDHCEALFEIEKGKQENFTILGLIKILIILR